MSLVYGKLIIMVRSQDSMAKDGWTFMGTTTDKTMLSEIERDYIATGAKEVAFTWFSSLSDTVLYWTRP